MCDCDFTKAFLKQLFDIGKSSGSLISQALGLFRLFQKISALKSFSAHFSNDCLKMFNWASKLIKIFNELLHLKTLTDLEEFTMYSFSFPLMILVFISGLISHMFLIPSFLLYGACVMIGLGFGYIKINLSAAIGCPIAGAIIIAIFIWKFTALFDIFDDVQSIIPFTFSLVAGLLTFTLISYPITHKNFITGAFTFILLGVVAVISLIVEFIFICVNSARKKLDFDSYLTKIISFGLNCLLLFIIPATESFTNLMQSESYKNNWSCILGYIFVPLFIPIFTTFCFVYFKVPDTIDKYRDCSISFFDYNPLFIFEIIDIIKQIIFAIVASYDILWCCIALEIAWFISIFVFRPFKNISDYFLQAGDSLIIFIEYGSILHNSYHENNYFTFKKALAFVIIACIPAILSIYTFFIFDFEPDEKEEEKQTLDEIGFLINIITPFAFLFYGFSLPLNIISCDYDYNYH